MMNTTVLMPRWPNWKTILALLALLACLSLLMTSCAARPQRFYTGLDYLHLKQGETFVAPRDMTLATESVVQSKDRQILELVAALKKLQAERDLK